MINFMLMAVGIALLFIIYKFMKHEMVSSNISIQRYCTLAKFDELRDSKIILIRLASVGVNFALIVFGLYYCIFGEELDSRYNAGSISLYIVADITLFYIVHLGVIKQRHDILTFLRIAILELMIALVIIASLIVNVQGINILDIVLAQNELVAGIPQWNAIVLLPLFYIWNANSVDCVRSLAVDRLETEVDRFQTRLLYAARYIAWGVLTITLFFGGGNFFELFDLFNFNNTGINSLELILFLIKFILVLLVGKIYTRLVGPRKLVEIESLYKKRALFVVVIFICISLYKVAQF
mgnify:FL=1